MEATDLMIGDWILIFVWDCKPFPSKVTSINYNSYQGKNFADWIDTEDEEEIGIYNVQPIPLTPEILKKSGFTKYDVGHKVSGWTIMDEEYCSDIPFTLTDDDFDTELGDYKWGPVEDDREESFVREVGRIKYVHELQHLLKHCKIEKNIIL